MVAPLKGDYRVTRRGYCGGGGKDLRHLLPRTAARLASAENAVGANTSSADEWRPARVVALIPAHDEAEQIADTIASLRAQTYPVARIVVMADNCSDSTADVATSSGADVYVTTDNKAKKAGALNQGMRELAEEKEKGVGGRREEMDHTLALLGRPRCEPGGKYLGEPEGVEAVADSIPGRPCRELDLQGSPGRERSGFQVALDVGQHRPGDAERHRHVVGLGISRNVAKLPE